MTRRQVSIALRKGVAVGLCYSCSLSLAPAQQASIDPVRPSAPVIVRPYLAPDVPPVRLGNSGRLSDLIRAGTLYLTVQDAIALALENSIDIEVARYNPILSAWQLERSEAGGALPGVPSGAAQAGSVASGQGVAGSQAAAGVSGTGGSAASGGTANATISQVGPVTQNLDPTIQETSTFSHRTVPQFNIVQSITPVLISNTRVYSGSYQQGFLSGGGITINYTDHFLKENAPTDLLNPSVAPNLSFSFQHNLLRGFGIAVNARTITVAKINLTTSDLNFKTQVIGTVAQVLSLYYALVADYEDVKAKESAVQLAQTLYEDNQKQVEIGSLIPLDVTRAEAQLAGTQRDLVDSQTSLQQQELQLKNLISRTGVADPALKNARIVPLDRIVIPQQDDLAPLQELVQKALANRSDIAAELAGVHTAEVSALGTRNGILPSAQVFGGESQAGLAGTPHTVVSQRGTQAPDPYFAGGMGNALGQIFRRNFPTERIGAFLSTQLGNHLAQADYGIDQLQLRQRQLTTQKDINQVAVDVANSVVGLRQARVRYDAAVKNRELEQQLLSAEQKKYSLGASVPYNVIQQQRDLTAAQSAEIAALVSYSNARISLDRTLGTILDTNHVSIGEARAGKVGRTSSLPAALPQQP
ncbi:MAG: TolC family protein [Acidobacteriia bacterium]|nr:TolC family protein [Terriglobia bacterium]